MAFNYYMLLLVLLYLEKGHHVLRRAGELFPELFPLRRYPDRAVVRVADARHDAPLGDHGDRAKPSFACFQ